MDLKNPWVVGGLAVAFVGLVVFRLLPALTGGGGGAASAEDTNLVIQHSVKPSAVAENTLREAQPVYGTNPFREIAAPVPENPAPIVTAPPMPRPSSTIRPMNPGFVNPLPGTGEQTEVVPVTPPNIAVSGVIQNRDGASLVLTVDGKDAVVPVGGYVNPGLRLLEISGNKAVFAWKGKRLKIDLNPSS